MHLQQRRHARDKPTAEEFGKIQFKIYGLDLARSKPDVWWSIKSNDKFYVASVRACIDGKTLVKQQ